MSATFLRARQGGTGLTPSTSIAHKVLTVKEDGADFEAKISVPTYTSTERDALTNIPTNLIIFNSTLNSFQKYSGSSWAAIGSGAVLWANADLSDYCDGSTNTFNIGATPIANSTLLIKNGVSTVEGYGYEVSGSNITTDDNPPAGTILVCKFQYLI